MGLISKPQTPISIVFTFAPSVPLSPLAVSEFQVLDWGPGSIWKWFLCRLRDTRIWVGFLQGRVVSQFSHYQLLKTAVFSVCFGHLCENSRCMALHLVPCCTLSSVIILECVCNHRLEVWGCHWHRYWIVSHFYRTDACLFPCSLVLRWDLHSWCYFFACLFFSLLLLT